MAVPGLQVQAVAQRGLPGQRELQEQQVRAEGLPEQRAQQELPA